MNWEFHMRSCYTCYSWHWLDIHGHGHRQFIGSMCRFTLGIVHTWCQWHELFMSSGMSFMVYQCYCSHLTTRAKFVIIVSSWLGAAPIWTTTTKLCILIVVKCEWPIRQIIRAICTTQNPYGIIAKLCSRDIVFLLFLFRFVSRFPILQVPTKL